MSACELSDPFAAVLGVARGHPGIWRELDIDRRRQAWTPCVKALFEALRMEWAAESALHSVLSQMALQERTSPDDVDNLVRYVISDEFARNANADPGAYREFVSRLAQAVKSELW